MNTFGHLFRITTFGESHGPAIGCVIDACPPGIAIAREDFRHDLQRRANGRTRHTSARHEAAYGDRGFAVVGVATDRTPDASGLVAEFGQEYSVPYQILLSTQQMEDAVRNVRMMPTSFLVDREGRILQTIVGIRTKAQLEELILPLL